MEETTLVMNCTTAEYDYNDLIGQDVIVIMSNIRGTEFCLVLHDDKFRIVSEVDLDN